MNQLNENPASSESTSTMSNPRGKVNQAGQDATRKVGRKHNQNQDNNFSPGEGVNEEQQQQSKNQNRNCGCG